MAGPRFCRDCSASHVQLLNRGRDAISDAPFGHLIAQPNPPWQDPSLAFQRGEESYQAPSSSIPSVPYCGFRRSKTLVALHSVWAFDRLLTWMSGVGRGHRRNQRSLLSASSLGRDGTSLAVCYSAQIKLSSFLFFLRVVRVIDLEGQPC